MLVNHTDPHTPITPPTRHLKIMSVFATSKPVFTYFDLYGRGEACRMALVHSKTAFEDNRVGGETWVAFKASGKCNNGQIPVLEINGQYLNQSAAILRFIGSQTGAYNTSDPFAMWAADVVIDTCSDFEKSTPKNDQGKPLRYLMFGDALSTEDVSKLVEHRVEYWKGLQVLLGEKMFFGGAQPSIADFWVAASIFSWERNTQGKTNQSHVYAAFSESLSSNITMTLYADRMGTELAEHLATRRPGTM